MMLLWFIWDFSLAVVDEASGKAVAACGATGWRSVKRAEVCRNGSELSEREALSGWAYTLSRSGDPPIGRLEAPRDAIKGSLASPNYYEQSEITSRYLMEGLREGREELKREGRLPQPSKAPSPAPGRSTGKARSPTVSEQNEMTCRAIEGLETAIDQMKREVRMLPLPLGEQYELPFEYPEI
jgi:hypothetical protein